MPAVQLDQFICSSYFTSHLISLPYATSKSCKKVHFIGHCFGQSRHALRQSMLFVWWQVSCETNSEFTYVHAKKKNDRAKQLKGKTQSSKIPTKNTCSGHSSGPPFWCVQDVLKNMYAYTTIKHTHDTWFELVFTATRIMHGKNHQHIFSTHMFSTKCQGLTPPQGFRKRKQANCIQNGKAIYPP